jgi:hypothetical protein
MPKKMTEAQKAKLKKMVMQGSKINLDKPKPAKPSTSYSPRGMGALEAGKMYVRSWNKQSEFLAKQQEPKPRPAKPLLPAKPARPAAAMTRQVGKAKPLLPKKKAR